VRLLPEAKNNSFYSNSLFIFLIRFFPSLVNTLIIILFSKKLGTSLYGAYQNFWIQLNVIYPIACFGIHVFTITYPPGTLTKFIGQLKSKHYFLYALWLFVLSSIFALLQFRSLHVSFPIPFFYLLIFALTFIVESALIVFKKFRLLITTSILYSLAFFACHVLMAKGLITIQQLFIYLLIISVLKLIIYSIKLVGGIRIFKMNNIETVLPNNARSLWLHLGLYDIVQILFSWIDKFTISILLSTQLSAIYFNGSMNIPFLPLILSAVGSAVLIQLASGNKEDETVHTLQLLNHSAKILSAIIFPLFFFFVFYRYELFAVLLSDKYLPSVPIFLISSFAIPVRAYSFTTVLQNRHKGSIINTGAIIDLLLACILMYPLYKLMGLQGVALSFVITTYLQAGFYLYHTARVLKVNVSQLIPYANWVIKLIIFFFLFLIIHYISARYFSNLFTLILGCAFSIVVVLASLLIELKSSGKHG